MTKLQSARDAADEYYRDRSPKRLVDVIEARDKAVAQVCADVAYREGRAQLKQGCDAVSLVLFMRDAILHVIDPPASERERLGRAIYSQLIGGCKWEKLPSDSRDRFCDQAQAVLAEQQKIQEEQDDE